MNTENSIVRCYYYYYLEGIIQESANNTKKKWQNNRNCFHCYLWLTSTNAETDFCSNIVNDYVNFIFLLLLLYVPLHSTLSLSNSVVCSRATNSSFWISINCIYFMPSYKVSTIKYLFVYYYNILYTLYSVACMQHKHGPNSMIVIHMFTFIFIINL